MLLRRGADVTLRNFEGQTAVELASAQIQQTLLTAVDKGGPHRNLMQASWQGNSHVVKKILVSKACNAPYTQEQLLMCCCCFRRRSLRLTSIVWMATVSHLFCFQLAIRYFSRNLATLLEKTSDQSKLFACYLHVARKLSVSSSHATSLSLFFSPLKKLTSQVIIPDCVATCIVGCSNPQASDTEGRTALHYAASSKAHIANRLTQLLVDYCAVGESQHTHDYLIETWAWLAFTL